LDAIKPESPSAGQAAIFSFREYPYLKGVPSLSKRSFAAQIFSMRQV
jgi:hypothetical protein